MPESGTMKSLLLGLAGVIWVTATVSAQTMSRSPAPSSGPGAAQLEMLARKIDEQNAKIDMLSQQILKLQQQLANGRPGVMIGEGAPSQPATTAAPTSTSTSTSSVASPAGNSHIVARGETLTSIAKANNVSVAELQKFNHIENPLRLQAGQTILIPAGSSSPAASPNE
jgi:LysM repeat protein